MKMRHHPRGSVQKISRRMVLGDEVRSMRKSSGTAFLGRNSRKALVQIWIAEVSHSQVDSMISINQPGIELQ
jgi:hypothetical protein